MLLLEILLLALSAWGAGVFLSRTLNLGHSFGFAVATGFFVLPVLVFLTHTVGGLGLKAGVQVIVTLTLLAAGWEGFLQVRSKGISGFSLSKFKSPTILFLAFPCLVFLIRNPVLQITEWDEFVHWSLMPHQMARANAFLSETFKFKTLATYAPGWPGLLLYSQLPFRDAFLDTNAFVVPLVSATAFAGAAFDLIRDKAKVNSWDAWFALSLALMIPFGAVVVRPNLLIEIPGIHIIGFGLLLVARSIEERRLEWQTALAFGLIASAAFLLKKPFGVLAVSGLVAFSFCSADLKFHRRVLNGLLVLLPTVIVFLIWRAETANFADVWTLGGLKSGSWQSNRLLAIPKMIWALLKYDPLLIVCLIFAFRAGRASPRMKSLSRIFLATFTVYFFGLGYIYVVSMGEYEGTNLVSFRRYLDLMSIPIKCTFLVLMFQESWRSGVPFVQKIIDGWTRISMNHRRILQGAVVVAGISICSVSFFRPLLVRSHDPIIDESKRAVGAISESGVENPKVLILSQGDDGRVFYRFRYVAVADRGQYLNLNRDWSYGLSAENVWMQSITDDEFKALLSTFDVIWVHRSNLWLREHLKTLVDSSNCDLEKDGWLLSRQAQNNFPFACKPTFVL